MSTIAAPRSFSATRSTGRRPARRPAPAPASVRLTRRGRVVVLAAFVAMLFAVLAVFGGYSAATGEAGEPVETRTVMVREGDTLWGIASQVAEPGEVREMVYRIQELNSLPSAGLAEGQRLAVPVD